MTGAHRSGTVPDVPTVAEAGAPGFAVEEWTGLFAPTGTPPDIIGRLQRGVATALQDAEVRRRLGAIGAEPVASMPAGFASS